MKKTRKKHSATFKAQVAIEAIKEQETLGELAKRFGLHPQVISKWKQEFLSRGSEIFSTKAPDEEAAKREKMLYEKIGRLEV
ncbi:MAG: transposase, partial [Bacteroidales bacterium]|nr:transposase [Bacteroidales bacterium]